MEQQTPPTPESLVKPLRILVIVFSVLTVLAGFYSSWFKGPDQLINIFLVVTVVLVVLYLFVKSNVKK